MALLIDMIILLLLAGTLGYAWLVDRRVRALMAALKTLAPMVGEFSAAVDRTEGSVRLLHGKTAARSAAQRGDEPLLTRTAPNASAPAEPSGDAGHNFRPDGNGEPFASQLPPGMARITNKADLVRGFFDTARSSGA